MTVDDFFRLFVAFGGFVGVPALLLWGFARFAHRKQSGSRGPRIPTDGGSPGATNDDENTEAVRSGQADDFLRRLAALTLRGVASNT